jgi:tRNA A37 threonylcarbamoyladenosine synthetase subunit TsaC/SUA5/YrdC
MLNDKVFLTRTDTTIGFVSQNSRKLTEIKKRPPRKQYIKALPSLRALKHLTRVPPAFRNHLRRAQHTTFIMPDGHSYRIVRDPHHSLLLARLGWAYTTSANLSAKPYDETFAKTAADVIVSPLVQTATPSSIFKLGQHTIKRIR